MPREAFEATDLYTVEWDGDLAAVVHTWESFATGDAFREGCERLLDAVRDHDASKVLVDTRGLEAHDEADERWLLEEWVPRLVEAGVRNAAIVHSESVVAAMDLETFMDRATDVPDLPHVTSDAAEAREWLAAQ